MASLLDNNRWDEVHWDLDRLCPEKRGEILRSRVAAGIALLNEQEWGTPWYFQVSLTRLNIADPNDCVLGQLYTVYGEDGYVAGLQRLSLGIGILHGFSGTRPAELTDIWSEEILKLRAKHVQ